MRTKRCIDYQIKRVDATLNIMIVYLTLKKGRSCHAPTPTLFRYSTRYGLISVSAPRLWGTHLGSSCRDVERKEQSTFETSTDSSP